MFSERKTAQIAAFFLRREKNNRISILKLMKLLYIADREAVRAFGRPLSGDRWFSMEHGPVLSETLNLINGFSDAQPGGWEDWISDREEHQLSLRHPEQSGSLDELAPAEVDVLETVWEKFGGMTASEIRNWTHKHCSEWSDPQKSSAPIRYEDVARAVGFSQTEAAELATQYQSEQQIDRLFATL